MTRSETIIRQVSDLRDFYMKIKKEQERGRKTGVTKRRSRQTQHDAAASVLKK